MTTTTNSFPKELRPGLKARFTGIVNDEKAVWKKIFKTINSNKKYEEVISHYQFGLVPQKGEGNAMVYDNMSQGLVIRHEHKSYALGCKITLEAVDDNLYGSLSERAVEYLGRSHKTTNEYTHANILNNGFTILNNHQGGGDGKYLFATDHTSRNGTYSNLLTSAPLTRASLQDAITQIRLIKDETGVHPSGLNPVNLLVPIALDFTASEILGSMYQPDNANNAINTMYGKLNLIPWRYLDDGSSTAWYITTDAPYGLIHYNRKPIQIGQTNDSETKNVKIQSYSRYSNGVIDCRGVFGNLGS